MSTLSDGVVGALKEVGQGRSFRELVKQHSLPVTENGVGEGWSSSGARRIEESLQPGSRSSPIASQMKLKSTGSRSSR